MDKYKTIRIHLETVEKLRLIYGLTGEKMVDTLERLVALELDKVRNNNESAKSIQVQNISKQEPDKEA